MTRGRKLAVGVVIALIVVVAIPMGVWPKIHDKFLCLGDPPSLFSGYTQTTNELYSAGELPKSTYGGPAVVSEIPAVSCPTYPRPNAAPMEIWLNVGGSRYIAYVRGGGP